MSISGFGGHIDFRLSISDQCHIYLGRLIFELAEVENKTFALKASRPY